jgi:hypothetical protein
MEESSQLASNIIPKDKTPNEGIPIYFTATTDKAYFRKKNENNTITFQSYVTLKNNTDKYLLFKVYINKKKIYSTSPSTSFIKPNGEMQVFLKRVDNGEENFNNELIMFSGYPTDDVVTDVSIIIK